jgi:ABC-type multidrug transport system fused ATPase/permease subunit
MATFRRLLGFLRPYRRPLILSLALAWLAMGMTVLVPLLSGAAVNAIQAEHRNDILPLVLALLGAGVLRLLLTVGRRLIAGKVSLAVEFDLRQRFYEHLQKLTILFAAAAMFVLDPVLALIALAPVPFLIATATRYSRRNRPAEQEVQQRIGEVTAGAEESISGIRIVKAFARERHMLDRFGNSVNRVFEQSMVSTRLQAFYTPLMGFLPNLGLAAVLLVGGLQVVHGHTNIGHLTAFYLYVVMLSGPVRWLGMSLSMAQRAVASGNRMFEILDREPSMESPPGAPPLPEGRGQVSLQRVTLRYDGAERALSGIDLEVEPGRTIALVGPTAAGKTSLVGLLARLYDPSEGRVVIDGADIKDVDLASLRSEIAFVADDSFLFSDTVAGNIAYARPDATPEKIESAARRAQAHDFISRLPDGYETIVGERGLTLSGGQRQRIAIARALLAEPRILILDDATSSVDARTEAQIKAGLREAMEGRTTFIVAHRLSTISLADEIVVLDQGRIVDRGTHEELLERCPLYEEIAEKGLEDSVYLQRDLEEREELAKL